MKQDYILSIDQSTQGTKALLLDGGGGLVLRRDVMAYPGNTLEITPDTPAQTALPALVR